MSVTTAVTTPSTMTLLPRITLGHYGTIAGAVPPNTLVEGVRRDHFYTLLRALDVDTASCARVDAATEATTMLDDDDDDVDNDSDTELQNTLPPVTRRLRCLWFPHGIFDGGGGGGGADEVEGTDAETGVVHPLMATSVAASRGCVVVNNRYNVVSSCVAERRGPTMLPYSVNLQLLLREQSVRPRRLPRLLATQRGSVPVGGNLYDEWHYLWRPHGAQSDATIASFAWLLVLRRRCDASCIGGYSIEVHVMAPVAHSQTATPLSAEHCEAVKEALVGAAADDNDVWRRIMMFVVEPLLLMMIDNRGGGCGGGQSIDLKPNCVAPWPFHNCVEAASERLALLQYIGVPSNVIANEARLPPCLPHAVSMTGHAMRTSRADYSTAFVVPRRRGCTTYNFFVVVIPKLNADDDGGGDSARISGNVYVLDNNATLFRPRHPSVAKLQQLPYANTDGGGGGGAVARYCVLKCLFTSWNGRLLVFDVLTWNGARCSRHFQQRRVELRALRRAIESAPSSPYVGAVEYRDVDAIDESWWAPTCTDVPDVYFVPNNTEHAPYASMCVSPNDNNAVAQYQIRGAPAFMSNSGQLVMLFASDADDTQMLPVLGGVRLSNAADVMWGVARMFAEMSTRKQPLVGQIIADMHWDAHRDRYTVDALLLVDCSAVANVSSVSTVLRVVELASAAVPLDRIRNSFQTATATTLS